MQKVSSKSDKFQGPPCGGPEPLEGIEPSTYSCLVKDSRRLHRLSASWYYQGVAPPLSHSGVSVFTKQDNGAIS
jgi:hypothetical protein